MRGTMEAGQGTLADSADPSPAERALGHAASLSSLGDVTGSAIRLPRECRSQALPAVGTIPALSQQRLCVLHIAGADPEETILNAFKVFDPEGKGLKSD